MPNDKTRLKFKKVGFKKPIQIGAGRPTKYDPKYCEEIRKMFEVEPTKILAKTIQTRGGEIFEETEVACDLPTVADFALKVGVSRSTIQEWEKNYPEFSVAIKDCMYLQERIWQKNAIKGLYNPTFAIFMGKNVYGWKDKTEVDQNIKSEEKIIIDIQDETGD